MNRIITIGLTGLAFGAFCANADAQVFVRNTSDVPNQTTGVARYTENVDFADLDLDGDWDAGFAHGGDNGNIQDRVWINQGGLQGGTVGVFSDQTGSRLPAIASDGRDVEFVDIEGDGDMDWYVSNTSTISNQGNRWWINDGGLQAGTAGFFTDETASRWVGLNSANSSIPNSLLLPNAINPVSFVDWSCDCDFGDLDNDGDMDLVHSTYGGNFGGGVPTRIFLNDGDGFFSEFNPSGFKLPNQNISAGDPGLWCEGTQQTNTTNGNGTRCDIATTTLDIDLGDVDGDFDLDILHGDRQNVPRLFINRFAEKGNVLGFRDRTVQFASGYSSGDGHYEQEMGDLDGDGDLDLYGLNWSAGGFNFDDITMSNDGAGNFGSITVLTGSGTDDNEGDFMDYDNDGDLDLYVANFSGNDKLYRNNNNGGSGFSFTKLGSATHGLNSHGLSGYTSLDADACDVDNDGDYDVFSSQDTTKPIVYWENTTGTPDTTAPYLPNLESLPNVLAGTSGSADLPVRVHVYDNAPYYITWYNETKLNFGVDGISLGSVPAVTSGGQVFRGEIPSNLVGTVAYDFESEDEYGNSGQSGFDTYLSTTALNYATQYGTGTIGASGSIPNLSAKSIATPGKTLYVTVETPAGPTVYLFVLATASSAPLPIAGSGFLNVGGTIVKLQFGVTNALGIGLRKYPLSSTVPTGIPIYWQGFTFDGQGGDDWASTRGLEVNILP